MNNTYLLGNKPIRRIGFGAMQLAGPGVFGPPSDPEASRAVLRRAIELGVDHIDTAQFYGPDVVNDLIREALYPYPDDLKLVTKVGGRRDDAGAWLPAQTPAELRQGVEANLRSLQVERMDLVNLRLHHLEGDGDRVPLAEQLGELQDLREEGKLDLVDDLGEVQNAFGILDRTDEPIVEFTREHDVAFVPFFPLGSAFTSGPQTLANDPAIRQVASKHDATPSQIALAWLLAQYENVLLIPGTSSIAHLEENMAVGDIELDDSDLETLTEVQEVGNPIG